MASTRFIKILSDPSFPVINFVCIDEAHCVSEWSHNFRYENFGGKIFYEICRTSYLALNQIIRQRLGVKCVLALTATATKQTEMSICNYLQIPVDGILRYSILRDNLRVSMSKQEQDK